MLTFGSLFAGIGGFDLGFERAGMQCKWQVEIDPYCNRVLAKHWPHVRRWPDVRTWPQPDTEWVDVICGGFPCQDISPAGTKRGLRGKRSGLWFEFARIVRCVMPTFVVVENSAAITDRGMGSVLRDLAKIGYDAEWEVLSACAFGAPHSRDRMFLIAHPYGSELRAPWQAQDQVAPTGLHQRGSLASGQLGSWWSVQPEPCSVVYGVPGVVDRLRPYGNAVVPQVAEWIGRRIVEVA
jgi:DNA (cytosine-5)-methyltransferase 1